LIIKIPSELQSKSENHMYYLMIINLLFSDQATTKLWMVQWLYLSFRDVLKEIQRALNLLNLACCCPLAGWPKRNKCEVKGRMHMVHIVSISGRWCNIYKWYKGVEIFVLIVKNKQARPITRTKDTRLNSSSKQLSFYFMVWGRLGRARLVVEVVRDFVCDEEAMFSFSVLSFSVLSVRFWLSFQWFWRLLFIVTYVLSSSEIINCCLTDRTWFWA